jgi:hypothetical protein
MRCALLGPIPVYVPILFIVLVAIGISRCFPRKMRISRLIFTILLLLFAAVVGLTSTVSTPDPVNIACGIVGGGLGLFLGWHHVRRWTLQIDRAAGTILVPGDPLILIIFMSVFAFKFAVNYGIAVRADWVVSPYVAPIVTIVWCLFFGMTLGRNGHIARQYFTAT